MMFAKKLYRSAGLNLPYDSFGMGQELTPQSEDIFRRHARLFCPEKLEFRQMLEQNDIFILYGPRPQPRFVSLALLMEHHNYMIYVF